MAKKEKQFGDLGGMERLDAIGKVVEGKHREVEQKHGEAVEEGAEDAEHGLEESLCPECHAKVKGHLDALKKSLGLGGSEEETLEGE